MFEDDIKNREKGKWKLSDIGRILSNVGKWLGNAFLAALQGEFLLRLHVNKLFIHIVYTFFLFWVSIWLSMRVEKTLTKVEDNRVILEDMKIYHSQKTVELVSLGRMSTVQRLLEESGSDVGLPEEPADRIVGK